jgi:ABC-type cobalamin transport system ATPase subunit
MAAASEIDKLSGQLRAGERELCILGPSGLGKSSLVAAGVRGWSGATRLEPSSCGRCGRARGRRHERDLTILTSASDNLRPACREIGPAVA